MFWLDWAQHTYMFFAFSLVVVCYNRFFLLKNEFSVMWCENRRILYDLLIIVYGMNNLLSIVLTYV